jgi:hypothetical protein
VLAFSCPPSISTIRPFLTVISSVQESGQSSGQALSTVECPQDLGSSVRGICAVIIACPFGRQTPSRQWIERRGSDRVATIL